MNINLGLIRVVGNGQSFDVDPSTWADPEATISEAVAYAYGVKLQRCTASATDKAEAIAACREKLLSAEPHKGAGGGGMKANPELMAERQVVADVLHNSFGYGKTEAKKEAKPGWARLFEAYVLEEAMESGKVLTREALEELATEENLRTVADMHKEAYTIALKVAKGGTKAVKTTGFLKK